VDLGLFEKHGINAKLEIFPSGGEALEAVITGLADSTGNGQYNFPFVAARGGDVKAIAEYARSDRQFAAVGVGINGPQDLVGKRVGTQLGTSPEYYYRLYLEKYGIDPASVELVNIQFAQLVPALLNKDIDAYFAFGPHIVRGIETIPNASVFHYSGDDGVMPLRVYAGVGPKIYGDMRVAEAYVKALIEAGEILTANPEVGAELMLKYFDIELEAGRTMLKNFDYTVSFSAAAFAELVSVSKFISDAGIVPNPVDANDIAFLDAMMSVAPERTR
jgi:NitT/TauT family transport system substrate-binding protein